MNNILKKPKKEIMDIIAIVMILLANLVFAKDKYILIVCLLLLFSLLYTIKLIYINPQIIKKVIKSNCFLWIILFTIEMFLYGFFGPHQDVYSLKFHLLNIISILMLLIILYNTNRKIIDILAISSSIVITTLLLFTIIINIPNITNFITGNDIFKLNLYIVGNKNTLAVSYIFLLIPMLYKVGINKNKRYIPISILGTIALLLTGSKKAIISLIIIVVFIINNKVKKKDIKANIPKIIFVLAISILLCYFIPILHTLIWERFESMFYSIIHLNSQSQSSTGIRINAIVTVITKMWDKPIFGHGWGSYAHMYGYSSLYQMNLYTHNNYAEILFSFGLVGFLLYYWYPIRAIKRNIKNKSKYNRTLTWIYISTILFIDFGTVMCYGNILGFLTFIIVSILLEDEESKSIFHPKGEVNMIIRKIITILKYIEFTIRGVKIKKTIHSNIEMSVNMYNHGKSIEVEEIFVRANTNINTDGFGKIKIKDKVFINRNCMISSRDNITIGENCIIGPNVCIYDHDHNYDETGIKNDYTTEEVIIEKNCWIGAGVIILKGTHIGENCIIGAGTILKGKYPANSTIYNKKETIIKNNISK